MCVNNLSLTLSKLISLSKSKKGAKATPRLGKFHHQTSKKKSVQKRNPSIKYYYSL